MSLLQGRPETEGKNELHSRCDTLRGESRYRIARFSSAVCHDGRSGTLADLWRTPSTEAIYRSKQSGGDGPRISTVTDRPGADTIGVVLVLCLLRLPPVQFRGACFAVESVGRRTRFRRERSEDPAQTAAVTFVLHAGVTLTVDDAELVIQT